MATSVEQMNNVDPETGEIDWDAERAQTQEIDERAPLDILTEYTASDNIAELLDEDLLGRLGAKVCEEYDIDVTSRTEWYNQNKRAMKLAKQVVEQKTYPWPKASNVKYPLITVAAVQYNARAYSAIVNDNLVKAKVNGYDPDGRKHARADRVSKTMSWQCMEQMEEWDEEMDQLLLVLPIVGMDFKKTYFDNLLGRNVSERVMAENLVFNYSAKNFYKCPRKTHEIDLYPYEFKELMADGSYLECEFGMAQEGEDNDPDATHRFLEQHRLEDLDGDGYPEPYIVTVHRQTQKVVRIVTRFSIEQIKTNADGDISRIESDEYFTKYGFLPNPDGSAHDIGFGVLLGPMNVSVNRTLNMIMDAGHLANTQGGFTGKGLRMKGGSMRLKPGEFRPLNVEGSSIRDNLVQVQFPGPDQTLFQLLGFLVDAANDISSTKDILSGEQRQANVPASTTLALIEQGLKTHTAINKRVHRSLKREFRLLYKLNGRYLPPQIYVTFLDADKPVQVLLDDFRQEDFDISPAADPKVLTDMQNITRAEAMLQFADDPDFDGFKIKMRYLNALGIPDVEELRADPKEKQRSMMVHMTAMREEMQNKRMEAQAKLIKAKSDAVKNRTSGILDLAKAEAQDKELENEVAYYQSVVERMTQLMEAMTSERATRDANAGGVGTPEGVPAGP